MTGVTWGYLIDGLNITPQSPLGGLIQRFESPKEQELIKLDDFEDTQTVFDDLGREDESGPGYFFFTKVIPLVDSYLDWIIFRNNVALLEFSRCRFRAFNRI